MKLLKKLTAIIILLSMLITLNSPIISYAEGEAETNSTGETGEQTEEIRTDYKIKETEEWDISKNGDRSVIAKWTLEDRTVTISGSGEMKDWTDNSEEDWHKTKYTKIVNKIEIKSGLTNIGKYAFYECSNLTNLEIPNSVTSIGKRALYRCSSLTNITIPNSVASIGDYAFYGCVSLTKITIPERITDIGFYTFCDCISLKTIELPNSFKSIANYAFERCKSLTSINIPRSVTSIGTGAFSECSSLASINVEEENQNYISIDGVLFNSNKSKLICYPSKKQNTSYSIPESVTSIGDYAFYGCKGLTNLEILDNVTSIGSHAFYECRGLTNLKISDKVTYIGSYAFNYYDYPIICSTNSRVHEYCEKNKIAYVLLDNVVSNFETKYKIKEEETWDISQNRDRSVIAKWILEDRKVTIEGNGKMKNWESQEISDWHNTPYTPIVKKIEIRTGITNIGERAFIECSGLINIDIPSSITNIGNYAFRKCSNLTNVHIPNNIVNFGNGVFHYCSNLKSFDIPDCVTKIESYDFIGCNSLTNIILSNNIEEIGLQAFFDCKSLTSIDIPKNVKIINGEAFDLCNNLKSINVAEDNLFYTSVNGILFNKNKTKIIRYPNGKEEKEYLIPDNVTSIGNRAFYECENLKYIDIQSGVTNIEMDSISSQGIIIKCKKDSQTHRYAESKKIGYILMKNADLNENNMIDIGDLLLLLRHMAQANSGKVSAKHPEWKFSDKNVIYGDTNKNGTIDIGDVIKVRRYMAAKASQKVADKHPDWLNIE